MSCETLFYSPSTSNSGSLNLDLYQMDVKIVFPNRALDANICETDY